MAELGTSVLAMRAISALFLKRFLRPALFMIVILMVASYVLTTMLSLSFSAWWWLLLIILIPATLVLFGISYVLWFLLQRLLPRKLSKVENKKLSDFIETLVGIADRTRTPYPLLLFLVAKDVVRGRESSFLRNLIGDSKGILKEFGEIQALFRK